MNRLSQTPFSSIIISQFYKMSSAPNGAHFIPARNG
nr:MAG TPA: hypothetical protein [Caudoviricetes sp.]